MPAISIIINTELISLFKACIIDAITIAEGPVIPEIIGTFVPKSPATRHKIMAPHTPALAPNPVATPKARACGSAIIAALIPPKISPIKILNLNFIVFVFIMASILS